MRDQGRRGAAADPTDQRPEGDATTVGQRRWTCRAQRLDRIGAARGFAHERQRKIGDRACVEPRSQAAHMNAQRSIAPSLT
jgi:hypothetical protein